MFNSKFVEFFDNLIKSSVPIKDNKHAVKKLTTSKKSVKNKKLKGKKKLIDISN